jgi:biopolymer transport protein ExbD
MSEINVTPLVDVMLVLLVVFIVTAPLLTQAVRVNLPKTAPVAAPSEQNLIIVSIDAVGGVHFNDREIDIRAAEAAFAAALQRDQDLVVHLQGNRTVAFGKVAQVMASAQRAGVTKLSVITQQE